MLKTMTVDERFEAIVAGEASEAKMRPVQEPEPRESLPSEEEGEPTQKEEK